MHSEKFVWLSPTLTIELFPCNLSYWKIIWIEIEKEIVKIGEIKTIKFVHIQMKVYFSLSSISSKISNYTNSIYN